MKKFYEKSEIWFAVVWIIIYVVVMGNLRNSCGDESIYTTVGLGAIVAILLLFIIKNKLTAKYGFTKVTNSRRLLFFIPMILLCSVNLWRGLEMHYAPLQQVIAVINMALVGLVEELIFRGLLYKAIEKENVKRAIIISAVTFGVGHIINLLTGQANLDTILQVFYAIAIGFALVMMFYRSGSILPCIIVHSVIDITSKFSNQQFEAQAEARYNIIISIVIIIIATGYALYLGGLCEHRKKYLN